MKEQAAFPRTYSSLMKARKEGIFVQSEQEYRREQYRIVENQISRRQRMYEAYYGDLVEEKERIGYYTLIDRKYRGMADGKTTLYPEAIMERMRYIRQQIAELRELGVSEESLMELMRPERTLSRLYITADYRIFLPEYNNVEVKLLPLSKAVFILFLRHPEGIVLKEIGDYFSELWHIYKTVMGCKFSETRAKISIAKLCDPFDNSINEKISRVHESLRKILEEPIAEQYYINGGRSEVRQILLPQTLINWEN